MSALFYLLALYCFIRALDSGRAIVWYAGMLSCVFLAMGSKETAVTLPLLVLLYDRCLVAGSFGTTSPSGRIHNTSHISWPKLS